MNDDNSNKINVTMNLDDLFDELSRISAVSATALHSIRFTMRSGEAIDRDALSQCISMMHSSIYHIVNHAESDDESDGA